METRKYVDNGIVYEEIVGDTYRSVHAVGGLSRTETERIDSDTVVDITYLFDLELGDYVEQSRTERADPLPPPSPKPEDRIAQLESELLQTKLALAELAEANERDTTDMQLALAEIAELIAGGE